MSRRPRLRALARQLGIEDGYRSAIDDRRVATRDGTREALVAAMGFAGDSEAAAVASLARLAERKREAPGADPGDARCYEADAALGPGGRAFGIWTNLYSLRSPSNLGFGHLGDLDALVRHAAAEGAAFVGLNPLHAATHRPGRFCPYTPVSRLFRDPLYLDPERVPELASCREAREVLSSPEASALRAAARLDTAAVEALHDRVLAPLWAAFRDGRGAGDARRDAFAAYRAAAGSDLERFATFLALADQLERKGLGRDADRWPEAYRSPESPAVRTFADRHADTVQRHAWAQFELDRQLADVADRARDAGLAIGLYTDLALGSAAGGSDVWARPDLFAHGVSVGAPPDDFALGGQDWCFPPLDPHALRREHFAYFRAVVDANLRHAGALRVDHALGLRRLFWIPEGRPASEGAYVRYPEPELFAVLSEASRRHRAVLIAEDLGTVPEGFSASIARRGMLSSRVLLFERTARGFRRASRYPRACLATANTHDLPPLAALAGEDDLVLRRRVGQISDDAALAALAGQRRDDRRALRERLVRDGFLARTASGREALAAGVTAFLCDTPAALVGLSLDDLGGETEPINLPGVAADRHPSWTRRMGLSLDAIFASAPARAQLDAIPLSRRLRRSAASARDS
jgi:4-alpha-glucanotransferase